MTRNNLSPDRLDLFRQSLAAHVEGLKQDFPGFLLPSHHLAFHIYDFMKSFGNVRDWWNFSFENLIGKLQRIPTNHKTGEFELTLLQSFCSGGIFRQWLMRPDCPDLLKFCANLLDKAYGYDKRSQPAQDDDEDSDHFNVDQLLGRSGSYPSPLDKREKVSIKLPIKLARMIGNSNPTCYSQVPAPKGFYGTQRSIAIGNSYVCYRPKDVQPSDWVSGQIQYIFDWEGVTTMAITRSKPYVGPFPDPFAQWVAAGFEARSVSSSFSEKYDIVAINSILGHAARWELSSDVAVVLSLTRVSTFVSGMDTLSLLTLACTCPTGLTHHINRWPRFGV
ncbi:hypothetical protein C8R42DRAFT_720008 [Lentinula raphanica]|nr:hypothetical protein C8R42DRAFT_720008 [Lentinula raphanica]